MTPHAEPEMQTDPQGGTTVQDIVGLKSLLCVQQFHSSQTLPSLL